jgi:inosose dehydratase
MERGYDRRTLCKTLALGAGAACLTAPPAHGAPRRRLKIGHTSITWGFRPENAEPGIRDSARLGYHGYESLGEVLQAWEEKGGLGRILEEYNIPLTSAYCTINLTDPAKRKDEIDKFVRSAKLIKKYGGKIAVIGPNGVKRPGFDFRASKTDILTTLNELGKALGDIGMVGTVHQHTRTSIETRDEVYAIMDAVDTRNIGFGPDVAQLAAGGADPVKIVKDLLPLIRSVHLKDFLGGPHWAGYCPLGQGKVDIPAVMDLLEKSKKLEYVMVELDPSPNPPMTPFETAKSSKEYLQKLGYTFRA